MNNSLKNKFKWLKANKYRRICSSSLVIRGRRLALMIKQHFMLRLAERAIIPNAGWGEEDVLSYFAGEM